MKKRIRIIGMVLVIGLIVAYGIYDYMKPLSVETKEIILEQSKLYFTETGVVVDHSEEYIYPLVPGKVVDVYVKDGDQVAKGEVLATIDSSALEYELLQLESMIDGYEAQLATAALENNNARDTLKANRSNLYGQRKALEAEANAEGQRDLESLLATQSKEIYDRGLVDLEKYQTLYDEGIISESDFNEFKTLVNAYEANYNQSLIAKNSSEDYYEGMKASINAQIASINQTLEKDMLLPTQKYYEAMINSTKASIEGLKNQIENYEIKAPREGLINEVMIDNINKLSGLEPAFHLIGKGEAETSEIQVKVNTRDVDMINVGDQVEVIVDRRSGDVTLSGTITYIARRATMVLSPLGVEERKVLVKIKTETNNLLNTGYEADIHFLLYKEDQVIKVPNSALFIKDEADKVFVIEEGIVKEVTVTLGQELVGETVVLEGLSEGDVLITDLETTGLKDGLKAEARY